MSSKLLKLKKEFEDSTKEEPQLKKNIETFKTDNLFYYLK